VSTTPAPAATASLPVAAEQIAFDIKNFSLWYGQRQALMDVTIQIPARKVTAIIGPSGCGKSTFLRALNRMHELTPGTRLEGSLRHFGEDLYGPGVEAVAIRRRVGMIFQKSNPFPTMSIAENVLVGLRLNGVRNKALLQERLEQSLHMAALWDEVKDHPMATAKIEELIQTLRETFTVVIVTHNMQQAARCSDRTAFFYMGKLIEIDDTRKMFTNPGNPQTEAYVSGRFG
jgi:phosphate transport system ATP-binding protein